MRQNTNSEIVSNSKLNQRRVKPIKPFCPDEFVLTNVFGLARFFGITPKYIKNFFAFERILFDLK